MVVWGSDDPTALSTRGRESRTESEAVLADARSWGFGHDFRQPRPSVASVPTSR